MTDERPAFPKCAKCGKEYESVCAATHSPIHNTVFYCGSHHAYVPEMAAASP